MGFWSMQVKFTAMLTLLKLSATLHNTYKVESQQLPTSLLSALSKKSSAQALLFFTHAYRKHSFSHN